MIIIRLKIDAKTMITTIYDCYSSVLLEKYTIFEVFVTNINYE